jgi:pimeloyl-ACP methyl ester carboxylesterase
MPQLRVNGVDLSYIEQGAGSPVVFAHGAWMDLHYWEPQRHAMATQYRFMAYSLRYHGTPPCPDEGQHYSAPPMSPIWWPSFANWMQDRCISWGSPLVVASSPWWHCDIPTSYAA